MRHLHKGLMMSWVFSVFRILIALGCRPLLAAVLLSCFAPASAWAVRNYAPHTGYTETIEGERETESRDVELVLPPPPIGLSWRDRIFNEKLSKEFREKYDEKFGRTNIEKIYYSPNRSTYYNDVYGLKGTPQDISNERRGFGDYMVRRLTEYHVDDYLKNDPAARPIYEVKEAVSNIRVEVQQFRFDMQYSIAGNTFDLIVVNPYVKTAKLRLQMDPGAFGPSTIDDAIMELGRPITKTVAMSAYWSTGEGVLKLVTTKAMENNVSTSLTLSTFTNDSTRSVRESLYLAGVGYSF